MFERGVVGDTNKKRLRAKINMIDGNLLIGFIIGSHDSLGDILSDSRSFLEFYSSDGICVFISKNSISSVQLDSLPSADQLKTRLNSLSNDNPYVILGIDPDADDAQCANAYRTLTKLYHPDRLSSLKLPSEMVAYGTTMQRRINAAYDQIKGMSKAVSGNDVGGAITEQIYEHRPHWVKNNAA